MFITEQAVDVLRRVFDDPAKGGKNPSQKYDFLWLGFPYRQSPSNPCWALKVNKDYKGGLARVVFKPETRTAGGLKVTVILIFPVHHEGFVPNYVVEDFRVMGPYDGTPARFSEFVADEEGRLRGKGFHVRAYARRNPSLWKDTLIAEPGARISVWGAESSVPLPEEGGAFRALVENERPAFSSRWEAERFLEVYLEDCVDPKPDGRVQWDPSSRPGDEWEDAEYTTLLAMGHTRDEDGSWIRVADEEE